MSFETDGVTNLFFLVGSALVLTGGWLGAEVDFGTTTTATGHDRLRLGLIGPRCITETTLRHGS